MMSDPVDVSRFRGHGTSGRHAARRQLCAEYGVKNTGRQWRKLRQWIRRSARVRMAVREGR